MTGYESIIKHKSICLQFIVISFCLITLFLKAISQGCNKKKTVKKAKNIENRCPMSAILKLKFSPCSLQNKKPLSTYCDVTALVQLFLQFLEDLPISDFRAQYDKAFL